MAERFESDVSRENETKLRKETPLVVCVRVAAEDRNNSSLVAGAAVQIRGNSGELGNPRMTLRAFVGKLIRR